MLDATTRPAGAVEPLTTERADTGADTGADTDWRTCAEIARSYGQTFFLASRFLPPHRQRAIHATYAFCRIADDIADLIQDAAAAERALAAWEQQIETPTMPIAQTFTVARDQFGVPTEPAHDLIAGVRMDLSPRRYATWEDLHLYCYRVAGTVGLMVAPILGCRDDSALPYAVKLGVAMQLTNILRDIGEDAQQGRLYLPLAELADFGCDPEAILAGRPSGRFPQLIAFQIERARALYAESRVGLPALAPTGRFTTLVGSELYASILSRIEAMNYDVFSQRAHVPKTQRIRALPGIAVVYARLSWAGPAAKLR